MKKYILILCLCFAGFAKAQNINIPDANFKNALISWGVDTNNDGQISQAEAAVVTDLTVNNKGISSLQGIEYFTNLKSLSCQFNNLTTLDFSNNVYLEYLVCFRNQLTDLNVSNNVDLEVLDCRNNQIITLDLSNNTNLQSMQCGSNQLSTLNLPNSVNNNLQSLSCDFNHLTALDVSNNINLKYLQCFGNQLTTLDVSNKPYLEWLLCNQNQLTTLDVSNNINLHVLSCGDNQLTALDVSNNINLQSFDCSYNYQFASLFMKNGVNELYGFISTPNLTFICVDESQLTEIQNYVTTNNIGNNPTVTSDCLMATQEIEKNKISVYPNPVKDVLTIQGSEFKNSKFSEIYDISGKLVKTFNGNSVNVSALQKGIYILKIDNQSVKFIKE
ncbi:MAG: T9SS type A sorting domain-containing protein [Flavobacteriaceae bacterium]|jgi:Leucine-rich repeat (LRR) protein|nr:T9SS type A sorting domain-containing protein [Flavobacteriaceae bacterium]